MFYQNRTGCQWMHLDNPARGRRMVLVGTGTGGQAYLTRLPCRSPRADRPRRLWLLWEAALAVPFPAPPGVVQLDELGPQLRAIGLADDDAC